MIKSGKNNRISELDSLRAIAAISVMFFHYTFGFNHADTHTLFHNGFMGVELFFVISGFVIFMTLQNVATTKQFVVSRFARLYPAYWFSVILSYILFSIPVIFSTQVQPNFKVSTILFDRFLVNLSMIQSYFGIEHIDGAYWTLSVELAFYIVMLLVFAAKKMKYIELVGWAYVVLLFVLHRFIKVVQIDYFRYGLYFLAGIIFYNLYDKGFQYKKFSQYILLLVTLIFNLRYFYHSLIEQLIVILIYLIFCLLSFRKLEWFRFAPLVFLGQISYSMYLLHENIGSVVFNMLDYFEIENMLIKIITSFLIVAFLSYFSYYLFENLLRKKIIKTLN